MKKRTFFKSIFNQEDVCWKKIGNHNCIYVTLSDHVTKEEVKHVIDASVELILESSQNRAILVWNASKMKSYEAEAREHCQKRLKEHSDITDSVWVITSSTMVFAITEIISFFSSRTIGVVKSIDALDKKLQDYQKK